jgi:pSer/pThr/pTyr-binding forkhead associated (FHA) protein
MSRLIILARHGSVRQVNIQGPVTTIGRDPECDAQIDSLGVSRRHATIHWTGDRFVLTDLASFNGTFVNNERIWAHALQNGDAITMGECQLRFLYSSRVLPSEDALRLVTRADDLHELHAGRERSDWSAFFRRGRATGSSRSGAAAHYR